MNKLLPLILLLFGWTLGAQPKQVSFEELEKLQGEDPRPVLVFIHTDWCKYCQRMKQLSFRDEEVVELLDGSYYFISLDAEGEKDINFQQRTFRFKPNGNGTGIHEMAEALGTVDGEVSYPSICILSKTYEIIFQHNEALTAQELMVVLDTALKP